MNSSRNRTDYLVELLNGLGNVEPENECGEFGDGEWFEAVGHTRL
jgi:hypothetical protein